MSFSPLDSPLLGQLFTTDEMGSVFSTRNYLSAMLEVEAALAYAQSQHGLVPKALAEAIESISVDSLDVGVLSAGTAAAGVPVIPFVRAIQSMLPTALEGGFHFGTTTQDIADTALILQARSALKLIEGDIRETSKNLLHLAEQHKSTPCAGRTAAQHAAPITFGYKLANYSLALAEHLSLLPALRARTMVVSLGGPVGTLAAMGEHAEEILATTALRLGLGATILSWHTQRARIVELGSWLSVLIGICAKFATDIISLSSTEISEVAEPYFLGRGGSSAMPHKRNPISSMIILAAHNSAGPLLASLLNSMASLHERPVGMWHSEWQTLPPLFALAAGAVREANTISAGLNVYPDKMRQNLEMTHGLLCSDAAAAVLTETLGRAAAHSLVEAATAEVLAGQGSLYERLRYRCPESFEPLARAFDNSKAIDAAAQRTDKALPHIMKLLNE